MRHYLCGCGNKIPEKDLISRQGTKGPVRVVPLAVTCEKCSGAMTRGFAREESRT